MSLVNNSFVDAFGVCVEGYIEHLKGQVDKTLAIQALQGCRLAFATSFAY
jgi:hypothetical protein